MAGRTGPGEEGATVRMRDPPPQQNTFDVLSCEESVITHSLWTLLLLTKTGPLPETPPQRNPVMVSWIPVCPRLMTFSAQSWRAKVGGSDFYLSTDTDAFMSVLRPPAQPGVLQFQEPARAAPRPTPTPRTPPTPVPDESSAAPFPAWALAFSVPASVEVVSAG